MIHYGYLILAIVVSGSLGFLIAASFRVGKSADRDLELWQACHDDIPEEQALPAGTLPHESFGCCGVKAVTEEQIDRALEERKRMTSMRAYMFDRYGAPDGPWKPVTQADMEAELILAQNVREMDVETEG